MNNMFSNCKNLEYVNIKNYIPKNNEDNYNFFNDCPINIIICLGNEELIDKIRSNDCNIFDCTNGANEVRKKIYENDKCTNDCLLTDYNYEYKFKCYDDCPPNSMKRENDDNLSYLNLNKNKFYFYSF